MILRRANWRSLFLTVALLIGLSANVSSQAGSGPGKQLTTVHYKSCLKLAALILTDRSRSFDKKYGLKFKSAEIIFNPFYIVRVSVGVNHATI